MPPVTIGAVEGELVPTAPAPNASTWLASHILWVAVTFINWLVVRIVAPSTLVVMLPSALGLNFLVSGAVE